MLCWDYTYRRLGRRSTRREKEPSLRLEEGREPRKDFEKFVESTILRLANNSPSFLCNEFKFKFQGLTVKKTKQQQHEKAKKSAIILVIRARNFEYLLLNAYKYLNAPVLIILTFFVSLWRNLFFRVSFPKTAYFGTKTEICITSCVSSGVRQGKRNHEGQVLSPSSSYPELYVCADV